jgi:hypothetical protein
MRPQGPPPSPDEIDAWLETYPGRREGLKETTLFDAFNMGDEVGTWFCLFPHTCRQNDPRTNCQKFDFAVVKWAGYDVDVARKLQGLMA